MKNQMSALFLIHKDSVDAVIDSNHWPLQLIKMTSGKAIVQKGPAGQPMEMPLSPLAWDAFQKGRAYWVVQDEHGQFVHRQSVGIPVLR